MGKPSDTSASADDILSLIADVHTDTPVEQDRLEQALGTLESTHRQASAAMQRFERTGRTTAGKAPRLSQGSLMSGTEAGSGAEPEGRPRHAGGSQGAKTKAGYPPASTEVTYMGPAPTASSAPALLAASEERTLTAIAAPQKPIPVAEVLSGRGAEFVARGHTKTHIVHPKKNLPKK